MDVRAAGQVETSVGTTWEVALVLTLQHGFLRRKGLVKSLQPLTAK